MKFNDLDIGQRFDVDGVLYVKTSPVLASPAEGGGAKFMSRYVRVNLLDSEISRAKAGQEKMLPVGSVLAAFEAHHVRCLEVIVKAIPSDRLQQIANALESERQSFLAAILKR